ncbi:MAG TPA: hypothetical protein VF872_01205 [Gaiellaceae bacterium]
MSRRRPPEPAALPLRGELGALVHHYQHLHNDLEREKPEGSTWRELEQKLLETRERFDRLLEEWVADEVLREQWREYIRNRRRGPDEPAGIEPLAFQGVDDAGSVVQVRGKADEYGVWVDGSLQERIAARKDLSVDKPVLHFRWDGKEIAETFNASEETLNALAAYRDDSDVSPPWEYASELLADGLIDVHFDLTPRGKRAIAGL